MKKRLVFVSITLISLTIVAFVSFPTSLPTDPNSQCSINSATVNSWFESGAASLNGVVKAANSVNFPNVPNCSFYEWSEQMFLWLCSPTTSKYGGSGRIFNSPAFYFVSAPNSAGERALIRNSGVKPIEMSLRAAQFGKNRLPVILEKRTKRMFEIAPERLSKEKNTIVLDKNGREVEVKDIIVKKNTFTLIDKNNKRIINFKPMIDKKIKGELVLTKIRGKKFAIFIDIFGKKVETEPGQAGGFEVLMAQNGSLVYYITEVNQVFGYFLTGAKNSDPLITNPTQFPTTQSELNGIINYASAHGQTIIDPEALAIEVKSSWIEASNLPNPSRFITMKAEVPIYDQSNPNQWIKTGTTVKNLAMVGMHVVGSTNGHPEMIWATFEHIDNTPFVSYNYKNSAGANTSFPQTTVGNWLFCSNGSTGPFNQAHMSYDFTTNSIVALPTHTISPSDIRMEFPFGKPASSSSFVSNAQVIAANNSVRSVLNSADVRSNYIMTGATWTISGASPNSTNQVGTNQLANSTMETFQIGSNCFSCHATNTVDVSHIFFGTKKLF